MSAFWYKFQSIDLGKMKYLSLCAFYPPLGPAYICIHADGNKTEKIFYASCTFIKYKAGRGDKSQLKWHKNLCDGSIKIIISDSLEQKMYKGKCFLCCSMQFITFCDGLFVTLLMQNKLQLIAVFMCEK